MIKDLAKQLRSERRHGGTLGPATAVHADRPPTAPPPVAAEPAEPPPLSTIALAALATLQPLHPRLHESLTRLDTTQLAVVLSDDMAALVRAPVGSGKTTVLVHKLLYLHYAQAIPLSAMALLTFTSRAAREFRSRLTALADGPLTDDDFGLTGTFHAVARTLLGRALPIETLGYRRDFSLLDDPAWEALADGLIRRHKLRVGRRQTLRKRLRTRDEAASATTDLDRLATLLAEEKRTQNAMDFDDLIDHATTLLADPAAPLPGLPPRFILVDEMQDCEPRELAFLQALRGAGGGFFAVGDPHQAIYGFRGSRPDLWSAAATALGCRAYTLPRNYRSTRTIVDGARAVLGQQAAGSGSPQTVRSDGEAIVIRRHHDPLAEAIYLAERLTRLHQSGVAWADIAVLFRLRAQAEPIRQALRSRDIPCADPDEPLTDAVSLLTLHAGKGLEFRYVFLSGVNDGLLPLQRGFDTAVDAEERRLLFVGLSRARDAVEISYHSRPQELGASGEPSPYLRQLPAALVCWQDAAPTPPSPAAAPPVAPTAEPAPTAAWHPGQSVRHPRYGAGLVVTVSADAIDCTFGKLGPRTFPLALCPLTPS